MPQMNPMNWIFYFLIFSLIFLLFNIMNFYIYKTYIMKISNNKMFFTTKNKNWKW